METLIAESSQIQSVLVQNRSWISTSKLVYNIIMFTCDIDFRKQLMYSKQRFLSASPFPSFLLLPHQLPSPSLSFPAAYSLHTDTWR